MNCVWVLNKSTLMTAFSYSLLLLSIFQKSILSLQPRSSSPTPTNSNSVLRLLGEGAVTKILLYPSFIAAAMPSPIAADFPRPLAALSATVVLLFLSESTSTRDMITLAWSRVLEVCSRPPMTYFSWRSFLSCSSYLLALVLMASDDCTGSICSMCEEMGKILSSSSMNMQDLHQLSDRMKRSLNLGSTSLQAQVRQRWCTSMASVYSCLRLVRLLMRNTTRPPPSTVSMVLQSTLGVSDSKSCRMSIWQVLPRILWVSSQKAYLICVEEMNKSKGSSTFSSQRPFICLLLVSFILFFWCVENSSSLLQHQSTLGLALRDCRVRMQWKLTTWYRERSPTRNSIDRWCFFKLFSIRVCTRLSTFFFIVEAILIIYYIPIYHYQLRRSQQTRLPQMHQVSRLLNAIFVNEGSQNDRSLQQTRNRRSMPRRASGQELSHSQSSHSHSQSQEQECTQPSSTPTRPKKPVNFPKFVKNQIDDIDTEVIVVNISRTQYEVVEEVALELGWRVEKSKKSQKWDIMWIDSHIEAHDLFKLNEHQKISHFPAIYVLTRKNYLGRNLMKMRNLFPEDYRFFPSTWSVPSDLTELLRFDEKLRAKQGSAFYIYKPEAMAQGKGIKLYQNVELLQGKTGIVQQYINNPYLIEGLKFDLRIYVLIMGYDPLRIFIYDEGLGRFATENYEKVRKKNMKDVHMHLTNYAINKNSKNFIFNHSQKSMDKGHKRSLSAIYSYLGSQNVDVARLKASIDEMIVKTLIVGQPMIAHTYGLAQSDTYANDLCFQILGFDVLINDQLQPILLEVNHTPSFTTDTPLDKFIKKSLIKDTLNLLNVNVESKKEKVGMKKEHIELRAQRKLTKLTTEEKEDLRSKKWKERDLYELANLGNFRKIYPTPQSSKYNEMVQASTRIFNEINGIKNKNQCKMVLTSRPRSLERCNIRQSAESNVVAPTRKKQPKGFKIKKTISVRQSGSKFPTISANKKIERIYESPSSRKQQLINKSNQKLERATSYFRNEKAECQLEGELFARGSFVAPKMLEMNETQAQQRSMQLVNCTIMNSPNRNQIFYKVRNFEDIVNEASVQMSGLSQTKKSNFENLLNSLSSSSYYRPDIKQFRPSK